MAKKLNCWEFKKCRSKHRGVLFADLDICPTLEATYANGLNGGNNGGRICWAIVGSFSSDQVQGKYSRDKFTCMNCDFFQLVEKEEGIDSFELLSSDQMRLYKERMYGKRKCMRFDSYLDLDIVISKSKILSFPGVTRNISRGGFNFISENFEVKSRTPVEFSIKHPQKDSVVTVSGKIVWKQQIRRDRCSAGVKLYDMDNKLKHKFMSYVYLSLI